MITFPDKIKGPPQFGVVEVSAGICGAVALGFEPASYSTLKRMNKAGDRAHHETYISNTSRIFNAAVKNDIPIVVFMIAGSPHRL